MPQPLSPASRWLLKLSLSSTECFRKKSPSPSTASTTRSGDSHESSGKSGPPSIRSLGTQFGFGKSPSGEKVIACCGGEHELTRRRFNSTTTTIGLAHPHVPHFSTTTHASRASRATCASITAPVLPRLARANTHTPLTASRSAAHVQGTIHALLDRWRQASRERVDEEGESQVVNVNEIGELAGGNDELVIDLTNSVTIRGPRRSHSRPDSVLDKPLPTPPLGPTTLKPAIKRTPDLKLSPPPSSTAMASHCPTSPFRPTRNKPLPVRVVSPLRRS